MLRQFFSATAAASFSDVNHHQIRGQRSRLSFVLLRMLVFSAVIAGLSSVTYGQFGSDLFDEFNSNEGRTVAFDSDDAPPLQRINNGATNWRARVGHLAFETFGRDSSITHVELMPMIPLDNAALFTDWRLFVDNHGEIGANLGLGYRQWVEELNHVVGASIWYDGDNTSTEYFNQLGISLEMMGDDWDVFGNVYIPVGDDTKDFSVRNTGSRIDPMTGTTILFDQVRDRGEAMPGFDFEFGFLIPTDFAHEHEVRAYAGWYYFSGDETDDINGVKVRLQGDLNQVMTAQVELTDDDEFGTNVIFGGSVVLPGSLSTERPSARRRERHLGRFSQRNYNVIVSRRIRTQTGITAVNPSTAAPYSIQRVSTEADLNSTSDILLVDANTTLNLATPTIPAAGLVLQAGQMLLGENTGQTVIADGFGAIALPTPSGGVGASVLDAAGLPGNAITLASNTRVAGLSITNATGHGIIGSNISDVTLSDLTVSGSGMDNLFLQNVTGPTTLTGLTLGDATGSSFHLDGSTADVTLAGAISNTTGRSLLIENTSAGTTVDLRNATVQDSGAGVLISAVAGDVQLNDVTVTGGTGTGIEVTGNSGTVIFNGLTSVSGNAGPGINVHDTVDDAGTTDVVEGQVFFNEVNLTADGQTALVASNASSLQITNGTITATNSGAVADISDSLIDVRLRSIFADGGPFAVNVADTTGTFAALGDGSGTAGSGGLIQNMTTAITTSNAGTVFLQFVDFDANQHVLSDSGSSSITVAGANISNTTGGALTPNAIFVTQNTKGLEISGSNISNGNTIGLLDGTFNTVDSYSYAFANNSLVSDAGDLFTLTSQAGSEGGTLAVVATGNLITLNSAGTDAFDINWNGPSAVSVSGNTLTGVGTSTTGLRFNGASTTALSTVAFQNNDFRFDGAGGTGANIVAAGPSLLTLASNTLDFNGQNGVGMSLTLQEAGDVGIFSNLLTDDGGAGTGVLFTTIADQSVVTIENNQFQFNSSSLAIDRGIIFQAVETGGTISLSGSINNVISGATTPAQIPNNTSTGGFPVNGAFFP